MVEQLMHDTDSLCGVGFLQRMTIETEDEPALADSEHHTVSPLDDPSVQTWTSTCRFPCFEIPTRRRRQQGQLFR